MEIKIGRSAHACRACGRAFVHEESLFSLVRVVEGILSREDYCPQCRDGADRAGAYSTWTAEYYDPKVAEQAPPEVFSPLRQLFYEAVASEDRMELAKAFLAGQLLRRQKVFRLVKESDEADGQAKTQIYNDRIGNRLIEVIDPSFTYAELESARERLMARLRELEAPPAEDGAAADTAEDGDATSDRGAVEGPETAPEEGPAESDDSGTEESDR